MSSLMYPPIALYSDPITLNFSQPGAAATLDPQKMQNPSRKAMLIDEIRFMLLGASASHAGGVDAYAWAATLFTRLRVNRQNVTKGYEPIWALSKQVNNDTTATLGDRRQIYVYRPPCPIYVPQYNNLLCDFQVDPRASAVTGFNFGNLTFGVAYIGREFDAPVPDIVSTPFVGSFLPALLPANVNTPAQRSTMNDLVSPFVEPMNVKALIGRCLFEGQDMNEANPGSFEDITLRIMHSNGAIVARDYIPALLMFDAINRAWEMDCTLDRNEYLIASLTGNLLNFADQAMFQIAMHGYRDVPIASY